MSCHRYHKPKTKEQARLERELRTRETKFANQHAHDTDEQLLEYLRQQAKDQGTLYKQDVPGGQMIAKRFGCWYDALNKAGLPIPTEPRKDRKVIGFTKQQQRLARGRYRAKQRAEGAAGKSLHDASKQKENKEPGHKE